VKRVAAGAGGASKKRSTARGSITVEDDCSDDETDSNQSHFDSEEEGAVDCLNLPDHYDGGDGDNSEEEGEGPPAASSSSAPPAGIADALLWCTSTMMFIESHDLRSVPAVPPLPGGQVPEAVGLAEPITSVLPTFKGRNPGTRVNKTPGAPVVSTAADFFFLMWDMVMLGIFVAATNAYGQFNIARWNTVTIQEFKSFLAIVLYLGVVKYPKRSMPWQRKGKYSSPWVRSVMKEYRFEQILRCWHWTDTSNISDRERKRRNKENSFIGTVKSNSKGIPKDKVFKKTGRDKHARGEHNCEKMEVDIHGVKRNIFFVSWMDNKPVHFISTIFSKMSQVLRVVKEGGMYIGKRLIPIPTITMLYNRIMGGTDQFDQMLSYYRTRVSTKRWQTRVFTHFLMVAVVNASILYRLDKKPTRDQPGHDLLSYIDLLIDELATTTEERQEAEGMAEDALEKRFCGLHIPVQGPIDDDGNRCRRLCVICKSRISSFCIQCNVALCFATSFDGPAECFEQYHTRSLDSTK